MRSALALLSGLLFGLGLIAGGMTQPAVVLGFLDVSGVWNPQLLFVMAGAVATTAIGYRLLRRWHQPLLEKTFHVPPARPIDLRLLSGAAVFGIGWGLAGYCPGPALVSLAGLWPPTWLFVATMMLGWWLGARLFAPRQ